MAKYEVLVGNVGMVHTGEDPALAAFGDYCKLAKRKEGRCAGETVVILLDGEPMFEQIGDAREN